MTQLVWPNGAVDEPRVSDLYGPRDPIETEKGWTRPYHVGQDWHSIGELRAIGDGTVVESSWIGWAGWQVLIYLGIIDGSHAWVRYCHLADESALSRGDTVVRGDLIGTEGATGQVVGTHLHLEIYRGHVDRGSGGHPGSTIDPRAFIRAHLTTVRKILEETMSNPIVNVGDTLWVGTNDGEFVQYETPRAMNSRGIISVAFYGGKGDKDLIPSLSAFDFKVIRTVWKQMCQSRAGGGVDLAAITKAVADAVKAQGVTVDVAAIAKAVSDDIYKRMAA